MRKPYYHCINCGKNVWVKGGRCHKCYWKNIRKNPQQHPTYIDGRKNYTYCIDCNRWVYYGVTRCRKCYHKYNKKMGFMKGDNNPAKRPEVREKMSIANRGKFKELNSNWRGGKSFEEYGAEFDNVLKEQIRFKDDYKCQICGCHQLENGRQLDVHHKDYNKKNINFNNLISLCRSCHMRTNGNRYFWQEYFKNMGKLKCKI